MIFFLIFFQNFSQELLKYNSSNGFYTDLGGLNPCFDKYMTIDEFGNCTCLEGYFGDLPISNRGCWKCTPLCYLGQYCDFPGECKCLNGLYPNKKNGCSFPTPQILNYYPHNIKKDDFINITINYPENFKIINIFCKFNNSIIKGILINKNILNCKIPNFKSNELENILFLSISFDNKTYSIENVMLNYKFIKNNF